MQCPRQPQSFQSIFHGPCEIDQSLNLSPREQTVPHAKQVADANVGQDDQASAPCSLNNSSRKQHLNIDTQSCYERANEEYSIGHQYDWLATPDVTDLSPRRRRCCCCQKVGGSYPSVVGFGGVEMSGDGRDGRCDYSLFNRQWR